MFDGKSNGFLLFLSFVRSFVIFDVFSTQCAYELMRKKMLTVASSPSSSRKQRYFLAFFCRPHRRWQADRERWWRSRRKKMSIKCWTLNIENPFRWKARTMEPHPYWWWFMPNDYYYYFDYFLSRSKFTGSSREKDLEEDEVEYQIVRIYRANSESISNFCVIRTRPHNSRNKKKRETKPTWTLNMFQCFNVLQIHRVNRKRRTTKIWTNFIQGVVDSNRERKRVKKKWRVKMESKLLCYFSLSLRFLCFLLNCCSCWFVWIFFRFENSRQQAKQTPFIDF